MQPRRTINNLAIALAAIALGVIAQGYLVSRELSDGLLVYAIGLIVFLYAVRRYRQTWSPQAESAPADQTDDDSSPVYRVIALSIFAVAALTTILSLKDFSRGTDLSRAWTYHIVSVVAFLVSVYLSEGRPRFGSLSSLIRHFNWREAALVAAILGIAAFMRFFRFSSWPFGTWYDEADNALHVLNMIQDPSFRPVFVPSTNLPAHFLYLILLSFKLFGPSTLSIRVVTAVMGIATVLAAYCFGRELLGARMAAFLAFLLAVSRWDVNFSRVGLHGVSTPLFEFVVAFFVLRALRTQKRLDFAWAGLFTGLGLCFYSPFRLFPFVIILFLLHEALSDGAFFRKHALNLVFLSLAGLIVFAPVIQYAKEQPEDFWARTRKVSIFNSQPKDQVVPAILQNTKAHLLMFNYQGDPNGRHNLPGQPMLDYATSVLFVFGLGYCLSRLGNSRWSLLVVWLGVMICGGIFSLPFEAPQSLRAIGTLPVAYILAVIPLVLIGEETLFAFARRGTTVLGIALLVLAGWIGWDNYNTYFNIQARNFSSWNAYSTTETVMAGEINKLDPGYTTYFAPVLTNHLTTKFLAPQLKEHIPFDPALHLPFHESGSKGVAIFLDPDSFGLIDLLRSYYPGLQVQDFGPPFRGPTILVLVTITQEEIESLQGLPARYFQGEEKEGYRPAYQQDKTFDFDWRVTAPLEFPFQAEWRGVLVAPTYGLYGLRLEGFPRDKAEVRLDDAVVLGGGEPLEREIVLAKGRHDIRIRCQIDSPRTARLEWRSPGGEWETIPERVLYGSPVTANGLAGYYYPNDNWQRPPALVRIDPEIAYYFHLIPLARPYSVEWVGQLDVPITGNYGLGTESRDGTWLYVDDRLVLVNDVPDRYQGARVDLAAGRHTIRLRFQDRTDHSHVYLFWTPPGQAQSIVPYQNLFLEPGGGWKPASAP